MKKLICGLLIFVAALGLTACGKDTIVGTYTLAGGTGSDGTEYTEEIIKMLGSNFTLEFKEGNKAVLNLGDEKIDLTYDDKTLTGKNDDGEEESIPYTRSGKKVTFEMDGEKMIFEKK